MAMWNDYEKIARRLDRIANAFERIAKALETANIIEADRKTEQTEPQRGCDADCNEDCTECAKEWQDWKDQMWAEAVIASKDEPQTEYIRVGQAIDSVTGKVLGETYDVPQTDCSWK